MLQTPFFFFKKKKAKIMEHLAMMGGHTGLYKVE